MLEDKYIGLALAVTSSLGIGASFTITKIGLNMAAEQHGFEGDGFAYLKNPVWWVGIVAMVIGELCNFSAYAFAPAILVTPLGALSVLIGAVLGSYFLGERLGILGRVGCATCLIGSVVIVLHAPPDEELENIDQLLHYVLTSGFLVYCAIVAVFDAIMIYRVAPLYGKKNPLIYLSICSTAGSISIMAIKGFGIAVKLTLGGNNQFSHPSTYVFAIVIVVCILTQMNYFNKALSQFSTNIVNPLYYVTFTTCTLVASFILFRGFNTTDAINTISLLCGFLTIFTGVYLLNLSREDPDGGHLGIKSGDGHHHPPHLTDDYAARGAYSSVDGIPTDGIAGLQTRYSMQSRRSGENGDAYNHRRSASWSLRGGAGARGVYDVEAGNAHHHSLADLVDEDEEMVGFDEEDEESGVGKKRTSFEELIGHGGSKKNGKRKSPVNGGSGNGAPRRTGTVQADSVRISGKSFDKGRR